MNFKKEEILRLIIRAELKNDVVLINLARPLRVILFKFIMIIMVYI